MEKPFAQARGFFIYFEIGGEPFEQGIPHATKTSGTFLDRQRRVPQGRTPGWGEHCSSPPEFRAEMLLN
ncbi:hypothetical protein WH43_18970 [Rheinheimera sp. KL1]|nr:hypothetical protein WH43_18970 [Rheinheimera sp. KL1]